MVEQADFDALEKRIKLIENKLGIFNMSSEEVNTRFIEYAAHLDSRTLMAVFNRRDSVHHLAYAIIGLDKDTLSHLKSSLSKNLWADVIEHLNCAEGADVISKHAPYSGRRYFLEEIQKLEEMGEIVIGRSNREDIVSLDVIDSEAEKKKRLEAKEKFKNEVYAPWRASLNSLQ